MNLRQRQPRQIDAAFLAFVRLQRCCACDCAPPVQAAHIRMPSQEYGKRPTGLGEKPDDRWSVPLCSECHLDDSDSLHQTGEEKFWRRVKINPFKISSALYAEFALEARPVKRDVGFGRKSKVSRPAKGTSKYNQKYNWPSRPLRSASRWPKRSK